MQKVCVAEVKTGATKEVAPVFATILIKTGKYRLAEPEEQPKRRYKRRDLKAED